MRLTSPAITDAGLAVLDAAGYDGLSMRRVAEHLGVQVGGIYYHVTDKRALLRLMADRICQRAYDDSAAVEPGMASDERGWRAQVLAQCAALRSAMLSTRDGARLIAESPMLGSEGALAVMERLLATLGQAGLVAGSTHVAADTLVSYVTGFVLQEQLDPAPPAGSAEELRTLMDRFPLVFAAAGDGREMSSQGLFAASVTLILNGLE